MPAKNEKKHIPVTLPEPLTDHLFKKKTVCLGFKECSVKDFVTIQRCHRCLGFDHVAAQCGNTQGCSICAGEHSYKDCNSKRKECAMCIFYNSANRRWRRAHKPTDHSVHSGHCWVYNTLLQIRQNFRRVRGS